MGRSSESDVGTIGPKSSKRGPKVRNLDRNALINSFVLLKSSPWKESVTKSHFLFARLDVVKANERIVRIEADLIERGRVLDSVRQAFDEKVQENDEMVHLLRNAKAEKEKDVREIVEAEENERRRIAETFEKELVAMKEALSAERHKSEMLKKSVAPSSQLAIEESRNEHRKEARNHQVSFLFENMRLCICFYLRWTLVRCSHCSQPMTCLLYSFRRLQKFSAFSSQF